MADIASLAADIKETNRLLKILDDYATGEIKRLSTDLITSNNDLKALQKRVAELEKKQKK